jgi:hypothetical protein
MTAALAPRNTPAIIGTTFQRDVAAGARIWQGTIVVLAAGYAAPGSTALNLVADGRAAGNADNTGGAAGARKVTVEKGTFRFANSANADLIGRADIGKNAFLVDDQTVARTDGAGTRSIAGKIMDVGAAGVWVRFD